MFLLVDTPQNSHEKPIHVVNVMLEQNFSIPRSNKQANVAQKYQAKVSLRLHT